MRYNRKTLAKLVLLLSLAGLLGVCLCSFPSLFSLARGLALLGPVAVVLGTILECHSIDRITRWAIAIGVVTTLYLPTLWLPFLRA